MKRRLLMAPVAGALLVAVALGAWSRLAANGDAGDRAAAPQPEGGAVWQQPLGDRDTDVADGDRSETDAFASALAFARCMRDEGVDYPDPNSDGSFTFDGAPVDGAEFEQAARACREYRPTRPPLSDAERSRLTAATFAFAKCMREHGIELADPDVSGESGGTALALPDGLSRNDPDWVRAHEECQGLLAASARGEGGDGQ